MQDIDITFKSLFIKHYPELLIYATRLAGDSCAEDIVEDIFMDLWRRRETIDMGANIRAFLYRMVYNQALTHVRQRNQSKEYLRMWCDAQESYLSHVENDTPSDAEVLEQKMSRLEDALEDLPSQCREIFKLRYFHNMRNAAIADSLSLSVRTVEAQLYKALKIIRSKSCLLCLLLVM